MTVPESRFADELTLEMLGENITFMRCQWEELKELLAPQNQYDAREAVNLANRIDTLLERRP